MRLRKIKLSGFKSFVDPTTLNIPGNLVGIVGPNGCGKSNIIDAVTWVMGESSAKHLRGDSLTDVIFNGSNTRQPVGQASVELIFDNTEGKAGGQYASYSEISVKRQINRESISTYFLNGTRCRRRDITAIFLGTGLGPRSYSIIEQGMISRFIEARPEELRSFIEEAAGISKYRERRRETENRIRHTRENINRLTDIQEELAKQLGHLQRQARAAERYKVLKDEERQLSVETLALNWSELKKQSDRQAEVTREQETRLESGIADLRSVESEIEAQRQALTQANDQFSESQSHFYQIGSDISKLEQNIEHTREKISVANNDLAEAKKQLADIESQKQNDQEALNRLLESLQDLEPRLKGSRSESDRAYELLNLAEQAMQSWQGEWDKFNDAFTAFHSSTQSNRTRVEFLETALEEDRHRLQTLRSEHDDIDSQEIQAETEQYRKQLETDESALKDLNEQFANKQTSLKLQREATRKLAEESDAKRTELQKANARLETLQALQDSALGSENASVQNWIKDNKLEEIPHLAKVLRMDESWSNALEMVLSDHLQAFIVDDVEQYFAHVDQLSEGQISLLNEIDNGVDSRSYDEASLAEKVEYPVSIKPLLAHVYTADTLQVAFEKRSSLKSGESIITRDGVWVGENWVRISKQTDSAGMIEREQEINKLITETGTRQQGLEQIEHSIESNNREIADKEEALTALQNEIQAHQQHVAESRASLLSGENQIKHTTDQLEKLQSDIDRLESNIENNQQERDSLHQSIEQEQSTLSEYEVQKSLLVKNRDEYRVSLEAARTNWQSSHEESHGVALKLESLSSQRASLEQAIRRSDLQIEHVNQRQSDLNNALTTLNEPLQKLQANLEQRIRDKSNAEKELSGFRNAVQEIDAQLREKEQNRVDIEQKIQTLREAAEKARMAGQESLVRLKTIEEQLQDSEKSLQEILEQLEDGANISDWQEKLESVNRKIQRLGPINLAAIDEHAQLNERKEYLDNQQADLARALETLENAIKKIDKETKSRFKETFDKLNSNLQETFPLLFGGGHAYLELTSEDLLETGVTVMARPPGKRNTTIHLLSGGEKALTAVALVFSIFKLNPAPFCILDEVDAPLDDTNVGRFSNMVSTMAAESDVQFIVITHNKITMEIAHQLLGITMNEPGVSRIVSVDVDAAVDMAESA